MDIVKVPINDIKLNPNNPRIIKDDKFQKLVHSIKSFPEMLEIRPIVVNKDMIVLGGNMRLRACKQAGLKKIPIIKAEDLTEDQQREFIIKDNIGFGDWDWDMIANNWNTDELEIWGLDIVNFEPAKEDEMDDLSDKLKTDFKIEVICSDEKQQEQVYNKLIELGLECRLLTL